jgi:hypothetical protein
VKKASVVMLLVFLGGLSLLAIPAVIAPSRFEERPEF